MSLEQIYFNPQEGAKALFLELYESLSVSMKYDRQVNPLEQREAETKD